MLGKGAIRRLENIDKASMGSKGVSTGPEECAQSKTRGAKLDISKLQSSRQI